MSDLALIVPVREGRLAPTESAKATIRAYLSTRGGGNVLVKLSRPRTARSDRQNRYYWGVVLTMLADETGHSTEELHEYMKDTFLPRCHVTVAGVEKSVAKSTTALSTAEFEQYLQRIIAFAGAELGLLVPLPGEC